MKVGPNTTLKLPPGWGWSTPNMDTHIGNRTAAITMAPDLFEPEIAAKLASIGPLARPCVADRPNEIKTACNHTYTQAGGVAATAVSAPRPAVWS